MNTDMNQYTIFRKCIGMLINYCEKNDSLSAKNLVLGKLARHLCLQSSFLVLIYMFRYTFSIIAHAPSQHGHLRPQPFALRKCNVNGVTC